MANPTIADAKRAAERTFQQDCLSTRDKLDTLNGLANKLSALPKRVNWFRETVPCPIDQQLVIQVLYFVRGGDAMENGGLPVARLADRFDLSAGEAVDRIVSALGAMRERRPAWVEANFDAPLSRRMGEGGWEAA